MEVILLHEVEFSAEFDGSYQIINFEAYDPGSTLDGVALRRDYTPEGAIVDTPTLLLRDRGNPNADPTCPRYAVVVRRMGRATPVPQEAGAYVGRFAMNGWEFYVFGPRKSVVPQREALVSQQGRAARPAPSPPEPSTGVRMMPVPDQSRESPLARAAFGLEE